MSSFVSLLHARERAGGSFGARRRFVLQWHATRSPRLALSTSERFSVPVDAAVLATALDAAESRFLLIAGGSRLAVYDLAARPRVGAVGGAAIVLAPLEAVPVMGGGAHRFSVSSLTWFPHDSGLFVSGSFDHSALVWDANAMQPVMRFELRAKVMRVAFSSCAVTHSLVAAAVESSHAILCDLQSGKATHTLAGHTGSLRCAVWHSTSDWLLATAGDSGCIRVWDIRSASACLYCCEDARTAPQSAPPASPPPPAERQALRRSGSRGLKRGRSGVDDASSPSHNGAINSLAFSHDGTFLLSSGADNRMRLWSTADGANTLVNFPRIRNQLQHGHTIAIGNDDRTVFHPNGKSVGVYNMTTGELVNQLDGHFDSITGCIASPYRDELITGAHDRQILSWVPADDAQRAWRSTQPVDAVDAMQHADPHRRNELGLAEYAGMGHSIVAAQAHDQDDWSE